MVGVIGGVGAAFNKVRVPGARGFRRYFGLLAVITCAADQTPVAVNLWHALRRRRLISTQTDASDQADSSLEELAITEHTCTRW